MTTDDEGMLVPLTPGTAADLARVLAWMRKARNMTLREAAEAAGVGLSMQYIHNIEHAKRTRVNPAKLHALARAYRVDSRRVDDLLVKARVQSALEQRGIDQTAREQVWRAMEALLKSLGVDIDTDPTRVVGDMLR